MINQKYKYADLSRETVDGKRLYATPDGKKLPSVTTILDKTKTEEKKQILANWRKSVGHERAQQITTEAANRGTRMHTYLERYVLNGTIGDKGTNPLSWPSYVMAEEVVSKGLVNVNEFWGVEIPLYFPDVYAGTSDGVGVHLNEDAILDYKQSNKPKKKEWIEDYFMQLTAYGEAHNELYGTSIRKGVILMCVKPEVSNDHIIISPPQYQEFILEGNEWDHWRDQWWRRVEQYYVQNG